MNQEWQKDHQRIIELYSGLVEQYGQDPRSLDWGSRESQESRFSILAEIAPLEGTSILDLGCGLADLKEFFQIKKLSVDYTGYDITSTMIDNARKRFPDSHFEVRNILDGPEPEPAFDYVLSSGIFYLRKTEPMEFMEKIVGRMFALCRRGVAFNTLSLRADRMGSDEFYADPGEVLTLCQSITRRVILRHDYLPHDFTVYLYREGA